MKMSELFQTADWKAEKHVPVIEAPLKVSQNKSFAVKAMVGKEIAHPNTMEHHIRSLKLYFKADDSKFAVELATLDCAAHGEGGVVTEPYLETMVKLEKNGTFIAVAYCNIHGLWESNQSIIVEA